MNFPSKSYSDHMESKSRESVDPCLTPSGLIRFGGDLLTDGLMATKFPIFVEAIIDGRMP